MDIINKNKIFDISNTKKIIILLFCLDILLLMILFVNNFFLYACVISSIIIFFFILTWKNEFGLLIILLIHNTGILAFYIENKGNFFLLFMAAFIIIWLLSKIYNRQLNIIVHNLNLLILSYITVNIISFFSASNKDFALEEIVKLLKIYIIYFILFVNIIRNSNHLKLIYWTIVVSVLISVLSGIYFYLTNSEIIIAELLKKRVSRTSGFIMDPNDFATFLIAALPFVFYGLKIATSKIIKPILVLLIITVIGTVFLSFSRGGIVALISVIFYAIILEKKKTIIYSSLISIILSFVILYFVFPTLAYLVLDRIFSIAYSSDASVNERLSILKGAVSMISDYPFTGVGVGNFIYNSIHYCHIIEPRVAHNTYLEIWAETGIVGLLLFLIIIGRSISGLRWIRKHFSSYENNFIINISKAVECSMIGLCVSGMFLQKQYAYILWCNIALVSVIQMITTDLMKKNEKN